MAIGPDPLVSDGVDQDGRGIGSRCAGAAVGGRGANPPTLAASDGRARRHNGPMTKTELIHRIAQNQPQLVERDVALAVKMMLDHMTEHLADGGRIEIRGFASFSVRFRPRAGRAQSQERDAGVAAGEVRGWFQAGDEAARTRRSRVSWAG